ncbi:MAG TPA: CRISPR-associated protein Cas4 [Clostridiaceae bacterium]|nr:CRISPR-associated protein Cas4 [Clostridiaceae bacterium]
MKEYSEENYLMLSGIQHFAFCRRQWALIHIEQQWQENLRTVEGRILHEKAHDRQSFEKRKDIIISRGIAVFSKYLGVYGSCDVVEFKKSEKGITLFGREDLYLPIPIEYKKGKPKDNDADALQLCAQAICLEEMLLCQIMEGYLFYGEINHRYKVVFSYELRERVKSMFDEMHDLYERRYTPKVKETKACNACSLKNLCIPKLCKNISVSKYISNRLEEEE